jgi:hypothetical protein
MGDIYHESDGYYDGWEEKLREERERQIQKEEQMGYEDED